MTRTLTRAELHDLVWSMPMRDAAKTVGVSDVALKKVCRREAGRAGRVPRHWRACSGFAPKNLPRYAASGRHIWSSASRRACTRVRLTGRVIPPVICRRQLPPSRSRLCT